MKTINSPFMVFKYDDISALRPNNSPSDPNF